MFVGTLERDILAVVYLPELSAVMQVARGSGIGLLPRCASLLDSFTSRPCTPAPLLLLPLYIDQRTKQRFSFLKHTLVFFLHSSSSPDRTAYRASPGVQLKPPFRDIYADIWGRSHRTSVLHL